MGQKSFDATYKNAPRDRVDELLEFRLTHPIHKRLIDGVEWNYILSGAGSKTILIMSGLLGTAETAYQMILNLEKDYRVLSLSYPAYTDIGEFVDGLVKLIDLEGIQRIHFIGGSLGAGVGHVLVRRHADRIDAIVLSSFGLYNDKKLRRFKQFVGLFNFLPYWIVSKYYQLILPRLLKGLNESEKLFQIAYVKDILNFQNNKQTLISQYRLLLNVFENSSYGLERTIDSSAVLIIQTQDDTSFDNNEQAAFRQTYPNAHIQLFEEGGHIRGTKHQAEHIAIVRQFLESESV
jgi:pimeloyl-ACP methyl ester carboxylesterase